MFITKREANPPPFFLTSGGFLMQKNHSLACVRHGMLLSILALVLGVSWAAYMATHHESLHGGFEKQEQASHAKHASLAQNRHSWLAALVPAAMAHGDHETGPATRKHQHSHSGSLATDAMQRLLRGHIHWMGLGILSIAMLLVVAFTSLRPCWKKVLGWSFGIGALAYPPAWIIMGFRTVTMGPEAAEDSVMWLFAPAAALLFVSLVSVCLVLLLEAAGWCNKPFIARFFGPDRT